MTTTARLGSYQAALYDAVAEALANAGMKWRRIRDAQVYVDRLLESEWFFGKWPHFLRCTLERRGSGSRWSTCQALDAAGPAGRATQGVILIADGSLGQAVILHELAHLLAPPGTGHQPLFAEVLLELVRHEMGFFAFAELRSALRRRPEFAGVGEEP